MKSMRALGARTKMTMAAAFVAVMGAALLGAVSPARAAEIPATITDLTVSGTTAPGDRFRVDFDWSVPNNAAPGDTFSIDLPAELRAMATTFPLPVPGTDDAVANAEVVGGRVTFTLTDYVLTHENVSGDAHFWVELSESAVPGQTLTISWAGTTTPVTVEPPRDREVDEHLEGSKFGSWDDERNRMRWTLSGPLGYDEVSFSDTLQDGQTFDCSEYFFEYWRLDDRGAWVETITPAAADAEGTCTPTTFTATIRNIPDGMVAGLVVWAVVPAGADVVSNTATFTYGESTNEWEASAEVMGAGGSGDGTERNAEVSWTKVDEDGGALAGSEWSLTGPDGTAMTVVDNGALDADDASGALRVVGLAWGEYTLVETVAPVGYVLSDEALTVTVGEQSLAGSFGAVVNVAEVQPTPGPTPDPTPSVGPSGEPVDEPGETPSPAPSTSAPDASPTPGALGATGASGDSASIALAAGAFIMAGVLLAVMRRRSDAMS